MNAAEQARAFVDGATDPYTGRFFNRRQQRYELRWQGRVMGWYSPDVPIEQRREVELRLWKRALAPLLPGRSVEGDAE